MSRTLTNVDHRVWRDVIGQARPRLVFVAPGIRSPVAEAFAAAMRVIAAAAIHLVFHLDTGVCWPR